MDCINNLLFLSKTNKHDNYNTNFVTREIGLAGLTFINILRRWSWWMAMAAAC